MIEYSWPSSASSVPLKFDFWQVVLTSHSTEAQLIATYLSSIKMHDFGIVRGIAIYINIFSQIHLRGDLSYVEVSIGNNQRLRHIVKPSYSRSRREDCSFIFFLPRNFWWHLFRTPFASFPVIGFWHFPMTTWWYIASSPLEKQGLHLPFLPHILRNHFGSYLCE